MNDKTIAIIAVLIAGLFFGGVPPFSKIALHTVPPMTLVFIRFFIGSVIMTIFLMKDPTRHNKPTLKIMFISLIQAINPIFFIFGVQSTSAIVSQTLFTATPIFTVLFSYFLLGEKTTLLKNTGVFIGFIGTLVIILLPEFGTSVLSKENLYGNILIIMSVFCLTIYSILTKKLHNKYSPIYLTALFMYTATIITAILSIPEFIKNYRWWNNMKFIELIGVFYVCVPGSLSFLLYQYAIKHGTAVIASTINYISPLVAFIFASILLGEVLTFNLIIGALLVFLGVYIVTISNPSKIA